MEEETVQKEDEISEESNVVIWQPPVDLKSGEDFANFDKSLSDLKDLAEDEVKKGGRPLEVRIGLMNSSGMVELIFTEAMEFPDDLT